MTPGPSVSSARLVIVPGADHAGVLVRRDVMLPELRALLASEGQA